MSAREPGAPSAHGAALGLLAAASFGVSAPLAKRLLGAVPPQVLAGLLYLGAGLALSLYRALRPATTEAPLERRDAPTLVLIVTAGGVAGPLLMLFGLQRTSAVTGSLLLNLEAPFTVFLAVLVFREHIGRYVAGAVTLIVAGAASLRLAPGAHEGETAGALMLAGACAAWALDNNLTQRLSLRDPVALVRVKALAAGSFNLALGLALTQRLPPPGTALAALALGSVSYGASVVLDAYALRLVGAAREAAYFATAPFLGALAATILLGERFRGADALAMATMAAGVALLVRERHGHAHAHEALEHAHAHVHDAHHQHQHGPDDPLGEPHAHAHQHVSMVHDHPHVPDAHHRHRH